MLLCSIKTKEIVMTVKNTNMLFVRWAMGTSFLSMFAAPALANDHHVVIGESIQAAIEQSQDGDHIYVYEGVYLEALDFQGKDIEVRAIAGADFTVLDANGLGAPVVRAASGEPRGASLIGFALRGGAGEVRLDLGSPLASGGGVLVAEGSNLIIQQCVMAGNGHASVDVGGAIYVQGAGSRVDLINSVIHTNYARTTGGGVAVVDGASLQLESSTVTGNSSNEALGGASGVTVGAGASCVLHESILWGNGSVDLGSPAWLGVGDVTSTYSDIGGGFVGVGNQDVSPGFRNTSMQDYRLLDSSPCLDAGDPSSSPDVDGSVSDQGASEDYSMGAGDFTTYCDSKVNSSGCQADIFWTGTPSFSGPDDFHLGCNEMINANFGVLMWGGASASIPYMNATLCVQPPVNRKRIQFTAGEPIAGGADCSGTLHSAFSQPYMVGRLLFPGDQVYAQYWYRDPDHPDGTGISLSNAISFTVTP
jgi:hypothetical protein